MLAESCCAAVAVIHFHRRSVVFAVSPMLGFCTKTKTNFSQEMGVHSVFVGLLTQLCSSSLNVCVERGHTCAYIKLTFHLYQAWHILSSLHSGVVLS